MSGEFRTDVIALLNAAIPPSTITVYDTRIDTSKIDKTPLISVYNNSVRRSSIADDNRFKTTEVINVDILIATITTPATVLDTFISFIEQAILTDVPLAKDYDITDMSISHDYNKSGETDMAAAQVQITAEYEECFDLLELTDFSSLFMDIDLIEPFDDNLATIGPDGTIDLQIKSEGLEL